MIATTITMVLRFDEGIYIPGQQHIVNSPDGVEASHLITANMIQFLRGTVEDLGVDVRACYSTQTFQLEEL